MNFFLIASIVLITTAFMILKGESSGGEDNSLHLTIVKLYSAANEGGPAEAIELWKLGNLIDEDSELKKIAPLNVRADLLRKAADKGSSEALFKYSIYSLRGLRDAKLFLRYLKQSSDKGHAMATVTVALINAFHEKNEESAKRALDKIKNIVPKDKLDIFDSRININSINLLTKAITKQDLALLQSNAESNQEMEILTCIHIFDDYKAQLIADERGE